MSRITYECDNGTDSLGNEVVDMFCPGWYMVRVTIDGLLKILRTERARRQAQGVKEDDGE